MTLPSQPDVMHGFETDSEYRAIEAALLETPRGRWFLSEHGRRARRLDSAALDDALQRLNETLRQPPALLGALQREIEGLRTTLSEAATALLAKTAPEVGEGSGIAQGILKASEDLHELAWSLQANDINPEACETIARNASRIYGLSQLQAVEGTRARMFAETLSEAAVRLEALLEIIAHEMKVDNPNS